MSLSSVSSIALSGIFASEQMLDVTANNLANQRTPGFKQSRIELATQTPTGTSPQLARGTGVVVVSTTRDTSQGHLIQSESGLDLAVDGKGFFILEGDQGEPRFTRHGAFQLNADGYLVSAGGRRVLGYRQGSGNQMMPLRIVGSGPNGPRDLQIDSNGQIFETVNGAPAVQGQIRLAQFNNVRGLRGVGNSEFVPTANSGIAQTGNPGTASLGMLRVGALEASNTDIAGNLVNLFRAENMFRANVEVLSVADEMWQDLFERVRS